MGANSEIEVYALYDKRGDEEVLREVRYRIGGFDEKVPIGFLRKSERPKLESMLRRAYELGVTVTARGLCCDGAPTE